jgi:hypothetical protein
MQSSFTSSAPAPIHEKQIINLFPKLLALQHSCWESLIQWTQPQLNLSHTIVELDCFKFPLPHFATEPDPSPVKYSSYSSQRRRTNWKTGSFSRLQHNSTLPSCIWECDSQQHWESLSQSIQAQLTHHHTLVPFCTMKFLLCSIVTCLVGVHTFSYFQFRFSHFWSLLE